MKLFSKIMYHGSAKRFDKFEYEFIDTGHNGHAHGWGIYLAANRSTSEGYRPTEETTYFGGLTIEEVLNKRGINCPYFNAWFDHEGNVFNKIKDKIPRRIETIRSRGDENLANQLQQILDIIPELDDAKDAQAGMLATVELPDDIVLVEEHVPIMEQGEFIINACAEVFQNSWSKYRFNVNNLDNWIKQLDVYIDPRTIYMTAWGGFKAALFEQVINLRKNNTEITPEMMLTALRKGQKYYDFKLIEGKDDEFAQKYYNMVKDCIEESDKVDFGNKTFRQIYVNYDEKEAALELRDNGIDGITYDGRIDQECIVLFNLEKATIIKKE